MPQKFVNLENLTSFWGNAKEYIGNERKKIEDQLYNWQKTEKAPVVQCEPVPNSDLHPVVSFSFTETSPASGEKGLDNPSSITGVSNISIGLSDNVYDITTRTVSPSSATIDSDGFITFDKTNNGSSTDYQELKIPFVNLSGSDEYSVCIIVKECYQIDISTGLYVTDTTTRSCRVDIAEPAVNSPSFGYRTQNLFGVGFGSGYYAAPGIYHVPLQNHPTRNNPVYFFRTLFIVYSGKRFYCKFKIIVCKTSDINSNIISLGNTYYGGSIDLATGLMTVTHYGIIFDSITANALGYGFNTNSSNENYDRRIAVQLNGTVSGFPQCVSSGYGYTESSITHFNSDSQLSSNFTYRIQGPPTNWLVIKDDSGVLFNDSRTIAENKQYFLNWCDAQKTAGTPVTLCYKLQTPFTVQLTSQQIKSLPSLEGTSKRINTIYTDADSVQVEYQKYIGIDSTLDSNSVNAIQNNVVNNALNTKVSLSGDEIINGTKTFSNTINGNITGDAGTVAGHIVSKDVPVNAAFTDTTYNPATQSTAGLMSASDKVKLDAVGSVFSFKGSVVNSSSLPASDNANGDAYFVEDTGHVHVYDGTSFVDIGVWAGIPSATDAQIDALFED